MSSPSEFLNSAIGSNVIVKLHSGIDYRGKLLCLDSFMNIALESAEEFLNGTKVNEYGDTFIRGNNGIHSLKIC